MGYRLTGRTKTEYQKYRFKYSKRIFIGKRAFKYYSNKYSVKTALEHAVSYHRISKIDAGRFKKQFLTAYKKGQQYFTFKY